jgi:translocator protein
MPLSEVDMLIVWASILWCVVAIWQHYRCVAVAMGAGQP